MTEKWETESGQKTAKEVFPDSTKTWNFSHYTVLDRNKW